MSEDDQGVHVPYNPDQAALEAAIFGVQRTGDFFFRGSIEAPMPRIEIEGIGVLSFPVPDAQAAALATVAGPAPYGRGEETLYDDAVRRVRQLAPSGFTLRSRSFDATMRTILDQVATGLGCPKQEVAAELYKMLVYRPGDFFLTHRDTEKAPRMFGTLVVALPSAHEGGELVIRHGDRTVTVDLSGADVAELAFVAFYADCEHEVRPIVAGHRVCLVFNLIHVPSRPDAPLVTAPDDLPAVAAAAAALSNAFSGEGAPSKLVWLFEHHYSPAGLNFADLKGEDAARAAVLRAAAARAGCRAMVGIVHISDSGSVLDYWPDFGSRRRRGFGRHGHPDETDDVDLSKFDLEVADSEVLMGGLRDERDRPLADASLPVEEGEVVPDGALDEVPPDSQRLTEATGNEGASFARAYHRAGLVLWPVDATVEVLLGGGVATAVAVLERMAEDMPADRSSPEAIALARAVIDSWPLRYGAARFGGHGPRSIEPMLACLRRLDDRRLLRDFIATVLRRWFQGKHVPILVSALANLPPDFVATALVPLVGSRTASRPLAVLRLLESLEIATAGSPDFAAHFRDLLGRFLRRFRRPRRLRGYTLKEMALRQRRFQRRYGGLVAGVLRLSRKLADPGLASSAMRAFIRRRAVVHPLRTLVPALEEVAREPWFRTDSATLRIWRLAARFALSRSALPPVAPIDWRSERLPACRCDDCRELVRFLLDPGATVLSLTRRQEIRSHLEEEIETRRLDLACTTHRAGRTHALVCTKTRASHLRRCSRYRRDRAAMETLLNLLPSPPPKLAPLAGRLRAALEHRHEGGE